VNAEALRAVERLTTAHDVDQFESGVADLDRWLRSSGIVASSAGTAATYVLRRGTRVVGYYALAMSAVVHADAPSRLRRGMPDPVPVVLLARLAVERSEQGNRLGGQLLTPIFAQRVRP